MRINEDPSRIPNRCPACDKMMYASARLRPEPAMTGVAAILLGISGIVAATIFLASVYFLREHFATRTPMEFNLEIVHYPPTIIVALVSLPLALAPGLVLGWLANRLPRVRRVRCWKCGWKQTYPGHAKFENAADPSAPLHSDRSTQAWPQIVDDNQLVTQCWRWAYDEMRSGRSADELADELIQQGWPRDEVEWMIDKCRREVRDKR